MKSFVRLLKRKFPWFIPGLGYMLLRLLFATLRVRLVNDETPRQFHGQGTGIIQVMWHSRLLVSPFAYLGRNGHILISSHGDGEIIARITAFFGLHHVRGSSRQGARTALKEMLQLARANADLIVTPDGPLGPPEVVKSGVAQIAKLVGMPVIPFAISVSRCVRLPSWDRFVVPLPFSRCYFFWGEPIRCGQNEDGEHFRLRVENALRETTGRADDMARS